MTTNSTQVQFLTLHVVPNAPRSEVIGRHGDALKIKLHAPAVDNKANAELVRFLCERLDLPKIAIKIVRGEKSREKVISFTSLTASDAEKILLSSPRP